MKGNRMILTSYEWGERIDYFIQEVESNSTHPVSMMADLAFLYRHIDGEVFERSEENNDRVDRLVEACTVAGVSIDGVAKIVEQQRFFEAKRRS